MGRNSGGSGGASSVSVSSVELPQAVTDVNKYKIK